MAIKLNDELQQTIVTPLAQLMLCQVIQPKWSLSLSLSLSLRGLCKVAECKNSIKRNSHNLTLKWTPKWQSCCSSNSGRGSSGSRGSLRHNQRALATIANQMASKVKAAAAADGTQQPRLARLQLAATCCNARARCIAKPVAVAVEGRVGAAKCQRSSAAVAVAAAP